MTLLCRRSRDNAISQADAIADLEAELAKARKQEHAYEEAIEALQADLDAAEHEAVKLKSGVLSGAFRILSA